MTTIAYRGGVLASDSRVTIGDTILPEQMIKVVKLESGALFGFAGNLDAGNSLAYAVKNGHPTPVMKKTEAILIHPNGDVFGYEGVRWCKLGPSPYFALGTGTEFALAAMWMGADAIKAVQCGIAFDKNSGGQVMSVRLRKAK